ncbi:hypothetical protein D3C75_774360 [compost metagenome]
MGIRGPDGIGMGSGGKRRGQNIVLAVGVLEVSALHLVHGIHRSIIQHQLHGKRRIVIRVRIGGPEGEPGIFIPDCLVHSRIAEDGRLAFGRRRALDFVDQDFPVLAACLAEPNGEVDALAVQHRELVQIKIEGGPVLRHGNPIPRQVVAVSAVGDADADAGAVVAGIFHDKGYVAVAVEVAVVMLGLEFGPGGGGGRSLGKFAHSSAVYGNLGISACSPGLVVPVGPVLLEGASVGKVVIHHRGGRARQRSHSPHRHQRSGQEQDKRQQKRHSPSPHPASAPWQKKCKHVIFLLCNRLQIYVKKSGHTFPERLRCSSFFRMCALLCTAEIRT